MCRSSSLFLVVIFHWYCELVKYPYRKTIHMISIEWSLTHVLAIICDYLYLNVYDTGKKTALHGSYVFHKHSKNFTAKCDSKKNISPIKLSQSDRYTFGGKCVQPIT